MPVVHHVFRARRGLLAATLLFAILAVGAGSCSRGRHFRSETQLYLAHNLWYEDRGEILSINYKVGRMMPAGTPISRVSLRSNIVRFAAEGYGKCNVFFQRNIHPHQSVRTIAERMFTDKPFAEMTKNLSPWEIDLIREGKVGEGMTKQTVLMAYGYPPEHKTPSLNEDTWRYWRNRFRTQIVTFDASGRVVLGEKSDWIAPRPLAAPAAAPTPTAPSTTPAP